MKKFQIVNCFCFMAPLVATSFMYQVYSKQDNITVVVVVAVIQQGKIIIIDEC